MAVNILTSHLLLSKDKADEAFESITIAEQIIYRLIENDVIQDSSSKQGELNVKPDDRKSKERTGKSVSCLEGQLSPRTKLSGE